MIELRVDMDRFIRDFEALAAVGATGDGGVHRPALSTAHLAARDWFRDRILAAGLDFRRDPAGNCSGVLAARHESRRTLLLGSHLDSVPNGGRFDGALGVLTALEVLRTIRESGPDLPVNLEAIDFTDEEGTLVGLLGSRALTGTLAPEELENPRGGRETLEAGKQRAGLSDILAAKRPANSLAGYLEVHIEQGPRLLDAGADIGIVEALVGIGSYRLSFTGRADHAGTTPMDARRDAGLGAAAFLTAARELVMSKFTGCVVNFGLASFSPGAYNIVPESALLGMEFRAPTQEKLDALDRELLELAGQMAETFGLGLEAIWQGCVPPAPCAPEVQQAFQKACNMLGLKHLPLVSGAGHDTQAMAAVCPAGMIFIPSTGGSHNPNEYASWEAVEKGANVMLHAAIHYAKKEKGWNA